MPTLIPIHRAQRHLKIIFFMMCGAGNHLSLVFTFTHILNEPTLISITNIHTVQKTKEWFIPYTTNRIVNESWTHKRISTANIHNLQGGHTTFIPYITIRIINDPVSINGFPIPTSTPFKTVKIGLFDISQKKKHWFFVHNRISTTNNHISQRRRKMFYSVYHKQNIY